MRLIRQFSKKNNMGEEDGEKEERQTADTFPTQEELAVLPVKKAVSEAFEKTPPKTKGSALTESSGSSSNSETKTSSDNPILEYLSSSPVLIIQEEINMQEAMFCINAPNEYFLSLPDGRRMGSIKETSDVFCRVVCSRCVGRQRRFECTYSDITGKSLMCYKRAFQCDWCCFVGPCRNNVPVFDSNNATIGSVLQLGGVSPSLELKDKTGTTCYVLKGTFCGTYCCACFENLFTLCTPQGASVGEIRKENKGCCREVCTNATTLSVKFADGMSIEMRLVMIAAAIIIDYLYYEDRQVQNQFTIQNKIFAI